MLLARGDCSHSRIPSDGIRQRSRAPRRRDPELNLDTHRLPLFARWVIGNSSLIEIGSYLGWLSADSKLSIHSEREHLAHTHAHTGAVVAEAQ